MKISNILSILVIYKNFFFLCPELDLKKIHGYLRYGHAMDDYIFFIKLGLNRTALKFRA